MFISFGVLSFANKNYLASTQICQKNEIDVFLFVFPSTVAVEDSFISCDVTGQTHKISYIITLTTDSIQESGLYIATPYDVIDVKYFGMFTNRTQLEEQTEGEIDGKYMPIAPLTINSNYSIYGVWSGPLCLRTFFQVLNLWSCESFSCHFDQIFLGCQVAECGVDSVLVVVEVGFLDGFRCFLEGLEVPGPDVLPLQGLVE